MYVLAGALGVYAHSERADAWDRGAAGEREAGGGQNKRARETCKILSIFH